MIKNFVTDCDGTLTDGKYYYSKEGKFLSTFHANDSLAMSKLTKEYGVKCIMITSGSFAGINKKRAEDLGIEIHTTPVGNKLDFIKSLGLNLEETAYAGDCLDDIPLLEAAKIGFVPGDALDVVKESADYVLKRGGGQGCILEAFLILEELFVNGR